MIDSFCPNEIEHINSIWDPQSPMVTSYRHQLLDLDLKTIYFTWIPCPHKEGIKGIHVLQKEFYMYIEFDWMIDWSITNKDTESKTLCSYYLEET